MCTGLEPLLFGSAATGTAAATTGLIGSAGSFSLFPAMMTAGTVLSTAATLQQGRESQDLAQAQAQQAVNQAAYDADAAKSTAEKIRKAGRAQVGEAQASLAASGVKLGDGTALEVKKAIGENVEQDALSEILSGNRAVRSGQETARYQIQSGQNARSNSYLKAAGTVLSGAASYGMGGWKQAARGS